MAGISPECSNLSERGTGPVFSAVKTALTTEELKAAFFLAADFVLADGTIEPEEKKLLKISRILCSSMIIRPLRSWKYPS